jgi:hypothetical protein
MVGFQELPSGEIPDLTSTCAAEPLVLNDAQMDAKLECAAR